MSARLAAGQETVYRDQNTDQGQDRPHGVQRLASRLRAVRRALHGIRPMLNISH